MSAFGVYAIWSAFLWCLCVAGGIWVKEPPGDIVRAWIGANVVTGVPFWLVAVALSQAGVIKLLA